LDDLAVRLEVILGLAYKSSQPARCELVGLVNNLAEDISQENVTINELIDGCVLVVQLIPHKQLCILNVAQFNAGWRIKDVITPQ
jgi:hypothetical protein